ncbi:FAD-dependent monooxygenase [Nocardia sp. CDC153]|uniref:FAD-dependent monooxygenase n=1 Tax=Nocardia sp. CDC153 TaxID=3112167 RepID=UPI002DB633E4|nr:FAD-dependent monooxygenase [Nocardia sp. CDC153]MEC3958705.1 FAD-dependent monooxygenase [Nocardia sp. CDC153]
MRIDTDVIIVGAGPTGLMLAAELRLAGVRAVVLERNPQLRTVPKANGFSGQIVQLLAYRGLSDRLAAISSPAGPTAAIPFGGMHVDFSPLADPPLRAMHLPQPKLEGLLDDWATELGAEVRRGHEVTGVEQDDDAVTVTANGPDGEYRLTARYLVACDGARSRVRALAGIDFPGTTYPEVNRLGQVSVPESVTAREDGGLEVAGHVVPTGFTRTDHGVFAMGGLSPARTVMIQTTEDTTGETDDNEPMALTELQESIHRVLGVELPLSDPIRLSRYQFQARQAERYRAGRVLVAGDAAHAFPATGVGINAGMLDAINLGWKLAAALQGWAPDTLLDSYHEERHFAGRRTMMHTQAQVALRRGDDPAAVALREFFQELLTDESALYRVGALIAGTDLRYPLANPNRHPLTGTVVPELPLKTEDGDATVGDLLHTARPVLLVLADRTDLREIAEPWADRVDIRVATTDDRPSDALLIRPDAHIAWAATVNEPLDTAAPALRDALTTWFGVRSATAVSD